MRNVTKKRIVSIVLCLFMFLQAIPMEVFASAQMPEPVMTQESVSESDVQTSVSDPQIISQNNQDLNMEPDRLTVKRSMYERLEFLMIRDEFLPNVGNSYTNPQVSDNPSYAFANSIFAGLYNSSMEDIFSRETIGELSNRNFTSNEVKDLMQQARRGDIIEAYGSRKANHYMVVVNATENNVLVYDCDFNKDSQDLISEHYITYNEFALLFDPITFSGGNCIRLLRASNYDELYADPDPNYYDENNDFDVDEGTLIEYIGSKKIVVIPDTVQTIESEAFENGAMMSVVIPNSVTSIGSEAFYGCNNLLGVELPNQITKIETHTFGSCSSLTHLVLPNSIKEIGAQSFAFCTSLKHVRLPNKLEKLKSGAFMACSNLDSILVPKSLGDTEPIGDQVDEPTLGPFINCGNLKNVYFEQGTTIVPSFLLYGCNGIKEIVLPSTIEIINTGAFCGASNLEKIHFNEGLTAIHLVAFAGCNKLKNVVIPNSVTSIGKEAFRNCQSLETVYLPTNLSIIEQDCFNYCIKLKDVTMPENLWRINSQAFYKCSSLETIELSDSLEHIEKASFKYCSSLKEINIPNSVVSLGEEVFSMCESLEKVTLGTSIPFIPTKAFYYCLSLKEVVIPNKANAIGTSAFFGCGGLFKAYIPKSVTTITGTPFSSSNNLTIYGYSDSTAIEHAMSYGINYEILENDSIPAIKVSFADQKLSTYKGSDIALILDVIPSNCTNPITWSSSDEAVAKVDANGVAYTYTSGSATITATVGTKQATCVIEVNEKVQSLAFTESPINMDSGESKLLELTTLPDNIPRDRFTWESGNPSAVTIDQLGRVTAQGKGQSLIKVFANDGSFESASCIVNVVSDLYNVANLDEFQSAHNYNDDCNEIYQLKIKGVKDLAVTFSSDTVVENNRDYIIIYDQKNTVVGTYTGTQLAGKTVKVKGDMIRVRLQSDDINNDYGFKVVKINQKLPITAQSIKISQKTLKMVPNSTAVLKAAALPKGSVDGNLLWRSSDPSIMSVKNGVVTAHGIGKAYVYVFTVDERLIENCEVEVSSSIDGLWIEPVADQVYTGNSIKPELKVYDGETLLELNKDYKVQYQNTVNVGNCISKKPPTIIVKGIKNYKGSVTSYFEILPQKIQSFDITAQISDVVYTGKINRAKPVLKQNGKTLILNKDYTLEYIDEDGTNCVGIKDETTQVKVKISGKGNFEGTRTIHYKIFGKTIQKAIVAKIENQLYSPEEIRPELTISYKNGSTTTPLKLYNPATKEGDYKVNYVNNTSLGTAKAVITGMNEYSGTRTVTFKIVPRPISNQDITITAYDDYDYLVNGQIIIAEVRYGMITLTEGNDYTISLKNASNARDKTSKNPPTFIIKGKGNYSGSKSYAFTISPKRIDDPDISITVRNVLYNNQKPVKGEVIVTDGSKKLKLDKDYKLVYSNNTEIGVAQVSVLGIGNYIGSTDKTFQVLGPIDLSDPKITVDNVTPQTYTGKIVYPDVDVFYDGTSLQENVDYKVSYLNAVKAALDNSAKPPTIKITGMGTFKGTIARTYTIAPYELNDVRIQDGDITVTTTDLCYANDKPRYSKVSIKVGNKVLKKDVDYTLNYYNYTKVAEANAQFDEAPRVEIAGIGNYSGGFSKNYRIYAKSIEQLSFSKIATQLYTGKELKPAIIVKDKTSNIVLEADYDYVVTYRNNTNIGYGEMTITGTGYYGGTKKIRFLILPRIFQWFFSKK